MKVGLTLLLLAVVSPAYALNIDVINPSGGISPILENTSGPGSAFSGKVDPTSNIIEFSLEVISGGLPVNSDAQIFLNFSDQLTVDLTTASIGTGVSEISPGLYSLTLVNVLTDFTLTFGGFGGSALETDFIFVVTPVPIPAALWLFITGLGGLGLLRRSRKRAGESNTRLIAQHA